MRLVAALLLAMASISAAAECTVHSGSRTNVLVELFTSEGCDSCPPADRWLSQLGRGTTAPDRVIPIAFHVDYWDYLGWKDRFADPRFTERQRALAAAASSTRVYTPQVMMAGRDFYRWRDDRLFARSLEEASARAPRATISITSSPPANGRLAASVATQLASGEAARDLATYFAVVESGHASRVAAGENRGETLRHDHVVREFGVKPVPGGVFENVVSWPADRDPSRSALVAFVQNVRTGEVLQALRAPVCRP